MFFSEGNYGDLAIRPTIQTAKAYEDIGGNRFDNIYEETETPIDQLDASTSYHYIRTLNNVKFIGFEKTYFYGEFLVDSDVAISPEMDIIKNTPYTAGVCGINRIEGNNIQFDGLNFVSNEASIGKINFNYGLESPSEYVLKNVVVKNCKFTNNIDKFKNSSANAAVRFYFDAENLTFENNTVDGYFKGVDVYYTKNIKVINNTIKNTGHNAIGIYDNNVGDIVIENNTIKSTGNRAIKFYSCNGLNITIKNNTITNGHDDKDEIIQFSNLTNSIVTMASNINDGVALPEYSNKNVSELYPESKTSYSIVKS